MSDDSAVGLAEIGRQFALVYSLGQVTCEGYPEAHDAEDLPCRSCGAAL